MSESDLHKQLVAAIVPHIALRVSAGGLLFVDGAHDLSDGCPPTLSSVRPDIFARGRITKDVIIGEAKTAGDIDNGHTFEQLQIYFDYLAHEQSGELWLSVPYDAAGLGHRVCRQVRRAAGRESVSFAVFGWMFGRITFSRSIRG